MKTEIFKIDPKNIDIDALNTVRTACVTEDLYVFRLKLYTALVQMLL